VAFPGVGGIYLHGRGVERHGNISIMNPILLDVECECIIRLLVELQSAIHFPVLSCSLLKCQPFGCTLGWILWTSLKR
jgi:hypothetical protein